MRPSSCYSLRGPTQPGRRPEKAIVRRSSSVSLRTEGVAIWGRLAMLLDY